MGGNRGVLIGSTHARVFASWDIGLDTGQLRTRSSRGGRVQHGNGPGSCGAVLRNDATSKAYGLIVRAFLPDRCLGRATHGTGSMLRYSTMDLDRSIFGHEERTRLAMQLLAIKKQKGLNSSVIRPSQGESTRQDLK